MGSASELVAQASVYIKITGCLSSTTDMAFVTSRTTSQQNQVSVRDPYYMPELLAFDALELFGTKMDKGTSRNRKFAELTDDEKAELIRFIKNTNPLCEILKSQQLVTFARKLLNMSYQSFQKRRHIATVRARVSNPNFSIPTFSDARTIVASKLHELLEGVGASSENKVHMSICLATPWSSIRNRETLRHGAFLEYLTFWENLLALCFQEPITLQAKSQGTVYHL